MGNPIASLLTALLLLVSPICFGQVHPVISHPVLEVNDQELHIFFDIINSGPNDRFKISALITDPKSDGASVRCVKNEPVTKSNER